MTENAWFAKGTSFKEVMAGEALAAFMRVCPERPFERGEYLFHQGEPATSLHVIASGTVKLVVPTASGHERVIAVVGPEDMIGEAFVLDEPVYRVDAIAMTPVQSCPMNRAQFMQIVLRAPDFPLRFSTILATSLIRCREALAHTLDPVKVRIAKVLLDQARRFGRARDGSVVELETPLRHDEIASLASATRVSASLAIAELRDLGLLAGTRGRYRVDTAGLQEYADAGE